MGKLTVLGLVLISIVLVGLALIQNDSKSELLAQEQKLDSMGIKSVVFTPQGAFTCHRGQFGHNFVGLMGKERVKGSICNAGFYYIVDFEKKKRK